MDLSRCYEKLELLGSDAIDIKKKAHLLFWSILRSEVDRTTKCYHDKEAICFQLLQGFKYQELVTSPYATNSLVAEIVTQAVKKSPKEWRGPLFALAMDAVLRDLSRELDHDRTGLTFLQNLRSYFQLCLQFLDIRQFANDSQTKILQLLDIYVSKLTSLGDLLGLKDPTKLKEQYLKELSSENFVMGTILKQIFPFLQQIEQSLTGLRQLGYLGDLRLTLPESSVKQESSTIMQLETDGYLLSASYLPFPSPVRVEPAVVVPTPPPQLSSTSSSTSSSSSSTCPNSCPYTSSTSTCTSSTCTLCPNSAGSCCATFACSSSNSGSSSFSKCSGSSSSYPCSSSAVSECSTFICSSFCPDGKKASLGGSRDVTLENSPSKTTSMQSEKYGFQEKFPLEDLEMKSSTHREDTSVADLLEQFDLGLDTKTPSPLACPFTECDLVAGLGCDAPPYPLAGSDLLDCFSGTADSCNFEGECTASCSSSDFSCEPCFASTCGAFCEKQDSDNPFSSMLKPDPLFLGNEYDMNCPLDMNFDPLGCLPHIETLDCLKSSSLIPRAKKHQQSNKVLKKRHHHHHHHHHYSRSSSSTTRTSSSSSSPGMESAHVHVHRHSSVQTHWHTTLAPACPAAQNGDLSKSEQKYSCHQCKCKKIASAFSYLLCSGVDKQFGKPCRKKFCTACLRKHYSDCMGGPADKWKCPSCLSLCVCAACLRACGEYPTSVAADGSMADEVFSGTLRSSGKRNKKFSCHQCKLSKKMEDLVFCTRHGDGKKTRDCKKKYCRTCLKKYSDDGIFAPQESSPTTSSWICPACLKVCCCAVCKRHRSKRTS